MLDTFLRFDNNNVNKLTACNFEKRLRAHCSIRFSGKITFQVFQVCKIDFGAI